MEAVRTPGSGPRTGRGQRLRRSHTRGRQTPAVAGKWGSFCLAPGRGFVRKGARKDAVQHRGREGNGRQGLAGVGEEGIGLGQLSGIW